MPISVYMCSFLLISLPAFGVGVENYDSDFDEMEVVLIDIAFP
jgi:hypothetical protein